MPLTVDDSEGLRPVSRNTTLDKPAPDDEPRTPDAAPAVHRAHTSTRLVAAKHFEDAPDKVDALGDVAVDDGEVAVLDLVRVDAEERTAGGEVRVVREELVRLCEVHECAHAREEEGVELLFGVFAGYLRGGQGTVWELARDEVGRGPV